MLAACLGFLIAFEHAHGHVAGEVADGAFQQRGLSSAWRADEVEGQDAAAGEPAAIAFRERLEPVSPALTEAS